MSEKILYVYKWATMGGVERVLLNRAIAFKDAALNIQQHVFFLHDSGGKKLLQNYIDQHQLGQYLQIVNEFMPEKYDAIHPIDTPEVFDMMKTYEKVLFECHTAYVENRVFLENLPLSIKGLAVPSNKFKEEILKEIPSGLLAKTYVLPNFVPNSIYTDLGVANKYLGKIPIAYIGRVDKLKNVEEVVEIFARLKEKVGDHFVLLVAGPITPEVDLHGLIAKKKLVNRFIYIPPVSFSKIPQLMGIIKNHDGIIMSASKGESFGLSIAEAIVSEIPIVASHIHGHLVDQDSMFLYQLNDIKAAVNKIEFIINNREVCTEKLLKYKERLSDKEFLEKWGLLG